MISHNVAVTFKDTLEEKPVYRILDYTNLMIPYKEAQKVGEFHNQETQLNQWINERGNDQHETLLELIEWELSFDTYAEAEKFANERGMHFDLSQPKQLTPLMGIFFIHENYIGLIKKNLGSERQKLYTLSVYPKSSK